MTVPFKPRKFSITIDDPDEAQHFLEGLIIAKSNNSSPYFQDLIDAVNSILEPHRKAILDEQLEARRAAGMA
jgi:hypothetical protein